MLSHGQRPIGMSNRNRSWAPVSRPRSMKRSPRSGRACVHGNHGRRTLPSSVRSMSSSRSCTRCRKERRRWGAWTASACVPLMLSDVLPTRGATTQGGGEEAIDFDIRKSQLLPRGTGVRSPAVQSTEEPADARSHASTCPWHRRVRRPACRSLRGFPCRGTRRSATGEPAGHQSVPHGVLGAVPSRCTHAGSPGGGGGS